MTTVTINQDTPAGTVQSRASSYPLARDAISPATKSTTLSNPCRVGQTRQTDYYVYQHLVRFPLSYLGTYVLTAAELRILDFTDLSTAQPDLDTQRQFFWIEVYASDWATSIDNGDFITGSSLPSKTCLARFHSGETKARIRNGYGGGGGYYSYAGAGYAGKDGYCIISWTGKREVWRYHGTFSWTCPTGVTSVKVELVGAGGGGAGAIDIDNLGGSGGGGAYASSTVAVTPGNSYSIVVGTGGAAGAANGGSGGDGGDSTFATTTVVADSGKGGSTETAGLGGLTAASTGDTKYAGGDGDVHYNGLPVGESGDPYHYCPSDQDDTALMALLQYPLDRTPYLSLVLCHENQRLNLAPTTSGEAINLYKNESDTTMVALVCEHSGSFQKLVALERYSTIDLSADSMSFALENDLRLTCRYRAGTPQPQAGSVKAFDADGVFMGVLPGTVTATSSLDEADRLDLVIPWRYETDTVLRGE